MDFHAQSNSSGFFISMLQECHLLKNGKPSGLDNQHLILQTDSGRPRATIYAHKNMPLWFNHDLSSIDVATCLWVTKEADFPRILVISAYWDIFLEEPPAKLTKSLNYARTNGFQVMLGMDSNAHTTLAGNPTTNKRGHTYLLRHNLEIVNRGNTPTFD